MTMDEEQFEKLLLSIGERRVQQKQSAFERHAQTVLVGVIMLVVGWVGVSILDMKEKQNELIVELKVGSLKLENLAESIEKQNEQYVRKIEYVIWKQEMQERLNILEKEKQHETD